MHRITTIETTTAVIITTAVFDFLGWLVTTGTSGGFVTIAVKTFSNYDVKDLTILKVRFQLVFGWRLTRIKILFNFFCYFLFNGFLVWVKLIMRKLIFPYFDSSYDNENIWSGRSLKKVAKILLGDTVFYV